MRHFGDRFEMFVGIFHLGLAALNETSLLRIIAVDIFLKRSLSGTTFFFPMTESRWDYLRLEKEKMVVRCERKTVVCRTNFVGVLVQ